MAILFGLPIILLVLVVRVFIPDWYMKMSEYLAGNVHNGRIAMFGVVLFYAYFRMQYKWEMNEQLYKELKSKENKSNIQTIIIN